MSNLVLDTASGGAITLAPTNTVSNYTVSVPATTATLAIENASTTGSALSIKSNATTGVLQVVGPVAASTRVMTTPDANFTAARTDTLQTLTGNQTITNGNVVVSSGYGIDFSATPGTGTSELFADYEEGTWTPIVVSTSGVITTYTSSGTYTKIGRLLTATARIVLTNIGTGTGAINVRGFPFNSASTTSLTVAGNENAIVGYNISGNAVDAAAFNFAKYDGSTAIFVNHAFTLAITYLI